MLKDKRYICNNNNYYYVRKDPGGKRKHSDSFLRILSYFPCFSHFSIMYSPPLFCPLCLWFLWKFVFWHQISLLYLIYKCISVFNICWIYLYLMKANFNLYHALCCWFNFLYLSKNFVGELCRGESTDVSVEF